MEAHKKGRDVMLAFKEDIGLALSKACDHDADADAIHLAMAANIVRREMFQKRNNFSGSFGPKCQEESVPISLLALVAMITSAKTFWEKMKGYGIAKKGTETRPV